MVVAPAPARSVRILVLLAAAVLAFALPLPSNANHVQGTTTGAPFTARFVHGGDNAWWVEVEVMPGGDGWMDSLQTQVEGSATLHLMTPVPNTSERTQQGWQKFAPGKAFNVPAGHRVMFWAGFSDAAGNRDVVQSCWFTHPAGAEQCGGSSMSSSTTSTETSTSGSESSSSSPTAGPWSPPFDASFTGVRGNEWWVQAQVATNGPAVTKLDVRLFANGAWGGWQPVAKQSWGWGSSYHIVQGTVVQLRATASDGQTDLSSCRQWIPQPSTDAALVTCPGASQPPPTGFKATYSHVKGNEWWAEVVITANQPVNAVGLRVNCQGEPEDMVHKPEWGKWVLGNVRIPAGSKVTFEANFDPGAASGGYVWPNATPTAGC